MQFRKFITAVALVGLAGATIAANADDKKDINKLYDKVGKAFVAKDFKALVATSTPDFTYTENGQTMTADQMAGAMQQQFDSVVGTPKAKFKVVSLKVAGTTADVIETGVSESKIKGADGKVHTVKSSTKSHDVVVKTDNGWLLKSITIVTSKMERDGKPYDPMNPAEPNKNVPADH